MYSFDNFIYLELGPDGLTKAIELEALTLEEAEAAQEEWLKFRVDLNLEWPPERIKEYILAELRRKCEWYLKKREALELENRDARVKGVSFKDRQHYSAKITALNGLFADTKAKGLKYSKQDLSIRDFVKPIDAEVVHTKGFENHLKFALI